MDPATRFALFADADAEPQEHRNLDALARAVHAARGGAAIQCVDDQLQVYGRVVDVVSVYRLQDGERVGLLGHAYLQGRRSAALSAALRQLRPDRGPDRFDAAASACLSAH